MSTGCKVDVITERYDLDDVEVHYATVDDHLYARWLGQDDQQPAGYRTLRDWFNKSIMKRVYDEHGRDSVSPRLDADFAVLTGDDELARQDLLEDLQAAGIRGEALVRSFVSWGTIRNHLRDCLDGEKALEPAATDWERRSVEIARDVIREKVEAALLSLATKDALPKADDAEVDIRVQVACPECPTRVPFFEALDRGFICSRHMTDAARVDGPS